MINIVGFLVFGFIIFSTEACSCHWPGNAVFLDKACGSQLSYLANVTSEEVGPSGYHYFYKLHIIAVYKGKLYSRTETARTSTMGSLCGLRLEVGEVYLLTGSRDPSTNVLKFGLCNYSAHMKDLSQEQWNHLYNIGCH